MVRTLCVSCIDELLVINSKHHISVQSRFWVRILTLFRIDNLSKKKKKGERQNNKKGKESGKEDLEIFLKDRHWPETLQSTGTKTRNISHGVFDTPLYFRITRWGSSLLIFDTRNTEIKFFTYLTSITSFSWQSIKSLID